MQALMLTQKGFSPHLLTIRDLRGPPYSAPPDNEVENSNAKEQDHHNTSCVEGSR